MSGMAGLLYCGGRSLDPAVLERMGEQLAHRGPEGRRCWHQGSVGLVHCLLSTTPESYYDNLPLFNAPGDLALTADARIDNRQELLDALGVWGQGRREVGDGELILRAYERWGEWCPERFQGDFAFAIWDARRKALFCARDPVGVRPFYYYRSDQLFAFASEIKALLCVPEVPHRLNEVRVADHLVRIMDDTALTFYQGILRLAPARTLTVECEGVRSRKYWSLDPSREIRCRSDEEYAEAFRAVFTEAVRCRLRSAHPLGSLLSGGLDSSSVVCMARALLAQDGGGQLKTFSALFDKVPRCDERRYVAAVLAGGDLDPHFVSADRLSPLDAPELFFDLQDEPPCVPNLFLSQGLYEAARQQGVRVLLNGEGGDDTVSHGLEYLTELARTRQWLHLGTEVIGLSWRWKCLPWTVLRHFHLLPRIPARLCRLWERGRYQAIPPWAVGTAIHPDFARRIGMDQRFLLLRGKSFKPPGNAREQHWRGLMSGLTPAILEVTDRAAAAFGLEPRYPFFDKRMMEFCLGLPPGQKLRRGWTRAILRQALGPLLPATIRRRCTKANLGPHFDHQLLTRERRLLDEVILKDPEVIRPFVDVEVLRLAYGRYAGDQRAYPEKERDAMTVWTAVILALWLHRTGLIC